MRSIFSKIRSILSKTRSILSKTRSILSKTQSNGRANVNMGPICSQGPILPRCSTTPRFSYGMPEPGVSGVGHCSNGHVRAGVRVQVGTRVGYTGWVPGVLYRGTTQPPRSQLPGEQTLTAKRAPDTPAGGGSGWSGCSGRYWDRPMVRIRPQTHPLQARWAFRGPLRWSGPSLRAKGDI